MRFGDNHRSGITTGDQRPSIVAKPEGAVAMSRWTKRIPWQVWCSIAAVFGGPIAMAAYMHLAGIEGGKVCEDGVRRYLCAEGRR